ncbi:hypothetical protein MATL_G00204270 [Megalops atlanticus]|uniref:NSL1 component of MIS12 kinetochore complex n=1 Tax=Megalops atlanticus TaxID=7932 RepID=A0A9D3PMT4_MEGAT|nr:hypothetical protein MATL_G00204270 [Megalops atlanticus]
MDTEKDYRVKVKSKKIVVEQLQKYRELMKKLLDGQSSIAEDVKQQMLQELLRNFDKSVHDNVVINGECWEDAPNEDNEAECKTLDDFLDENILETTLKRSSYPKKILPYVVRSLKAERELMGLYKPTVKPQEMKKDPVQETKMTSLSEAAPRMIRQASAVMKSLQTLQQSMEGLCNVLSMHPTAQSSEIHREVFGLPQGDLLPLPGDTAVSRQSLKRNVVEAELKNAYTLPPKRLPTASKSEDSE